MDEYILNSCMKSIGFDFILNEITPLTKYGDRCKENFTPFRPGQEYELLTELDKLQYFVNLSNPNELRDILKELRFLGETFSRANNNVVLDEVEFFEIKKFLKYSDKLAMLVDNSSLGTFKDLKIKRLPHLSELLDPDGQGLMTFYIYDSYSPKLLEIRKAKKVSEMALEKIKRDIAKDLEKNYSIKQNIKGEFVIDKGNAQLIEKLNAENCLIKSSESYSNISYKIENSPRRHYHC